MKKSPYLSKMRLNIVLAYVKSFLTNWYFLYPIWYVFETQFASPTTLGIIYAFSHLFTVILELPTGALADLIGRKKTIMIGLFTQGIGWIIVGMTRGVDLIWLGYLVNAFGVALSSGADTALHFDSLKELGKEKTFAKFSSKMYFVSRFSMIIATFLGGYMFVYNQRITYYLTGLPIILSSLLTFLNTEPNIDSEEFSWSNYVKQTKLGLLELFKNSFIKKLSLFYLLAGGITWYFVYFANVPFITELGFSDIERSWLLTASYIFIAIFMYFFTKSKLYTERNVFGGYMVIMVLGLIPSMFLGKYIVILPFLLLQLLGSARSTLLDQFTNQEFESKYRATAISALNMLASLFFSIIMLIGGGVIEVYGTGVMLSLLGIVSLLVVVPVGVVLVKRR